VRAAFAGSYGKQYRPDSQVRLKAGLKRLPEFSDIGVVGQFGSYFEDRNSDPPALSPARRELAQSEAEKNLA